MPKVTDAHRLRRREQILDAARRCFARNGFHATSMSDVLAEANLSAGALYSYFDSKSELIGAIAIESVSTVTNEIGRLIERHPDASLAEVMVTAVRTIRRLDKDRSLSSLGVQVWAEAVRDPSLAGHFAQTHSWLRGQVSAIITRQYPDLPADRVDHVAGVVDAILPGFLLQRALLPGADTAHFEDGLRVLLTARKHGRDGLAAVNSSRGSTRSER